MHRHHLRRTVTIFDVSILYIVIDYLIPMSTSSISFHVWGMRATRESWWYRRTKGEQGCVSRNPLLRLPAAWFCRIIIVADIAIGLYTTVNGLTNDFRVTLAFPTISLSDRSTAMRSITPIYYRLLGRILWSRDWFRYLSYFAWVRFARRKGSIRFASL